MWRPIFLVFVHQVQFISHVEAHFLESVHPSAIYKLASILPLHLHPNISLLACLCLASPHILRQSAKLYLLG
jgi:hypothetical protein